MSRFFGYIGIFVFKFTCTFLEIIATVFICINIYCAYVDGKFIPETNPTINEKTLRDTSEEDLNDLNS